MAITLMMMVRGGLGQRDVFSEHACSLCYKLTVSKTDD